MKTGGVFAIALCVLLCLGLAVFEGLLLVTLGPEYGIFDVEDVLFDVLAAFANGGTEYENTMSVLQITGFAFLVILGGSMLAILLCSNRRKCIKNLGGLIGGSCLLWTVTLLSFLLLLLFDFGGFTRGAFLFLLFVLLVITVVFTVAAAKRIAGKAAAVLLLGLAVGFFAAVILAGLIGGLLTVFGDLVFLIVLLAVLAGTGGSSRRIYVIVVG